MTEISAAAVKELREKTGAGMMDCKKALAETGGDMNAAVDKLRAKGLASAQKKSGRVAAEGLIAVALGDKAGALAEVNSETDFVAKNDQFQALAKGVAGAALAHGDNVDAIAAQKLGSGRTVNEEVTHLVSTIGENMRVRRAAKLAVGQGAVAAYVHNQLAPNMGKIGVLVALESAGQADALAALGKQVAMHIAAANPQSLDVTQLDPAAVERERAVLTEQAAGSGKNADIVAKMVEGRLRKFYQDVVLLEQTWVHDGETKVAKVIADAAKTVGAPVKLTGFIRFALGEGIEREQKDFASEVAATLKQ
jgi:elongation factor Ts